MSVRTRVKICGITRPSDAVAASNAGADAIGLVFYPKSSRYLPDLPQAREIALVAGPLMTVVGLFVDPEPYYIEEVVSKVPLNLIQFHGAETDSFCHQFHRPFIKAIRMKPGIDVVAEVAKYPSASGVLLDAYKEGVPGGTGSRFDWSVIPHELRKSIVLAGGLNPENVGDAVRTIAPYGVDVSGGVEDSPGIKNDNKIKAFVTNANTCD